MFVKNSQGEYNLDEDQLRSHANAFLDHAQKDLGLSLDQILWYEENRRNLRSLHEWVNYNYIVSFLSANRKEFR
jgi:hypothetical protein